MMTSLARKVYFSCGHFYKNENFSDAENREHFGACYNPWGHGHDYCWEVSFTGPVDKKSGLIIDLVRVDGILKKIVAQVDKKHLNMEVAAFKALVPTTENLNRHLVKSLLSELASLPELTLAKAILFEDQDIFSVIDLQTSAPAQKDPVITQTFQLRALHKIDSCDTCYETHGHHYRLEIHSQAPINRHGLVVDREKIKQIVRSQILDVYDGKNLNQLFHPASGEAMAEHFLRILHQSEIGAFVRGVSLQETRKNRFEAWL